MIRPLVNTLQIPIVESRDPEAKYNPFGENTTLVIMFLWPYRVLIHYCVDTLHTRIVLSVDPEAIYSPFGENPILKIVEL